MPHPKPRIKAAAPWVTAALIGGAAPALAMIFFAQSAPGADLAGYTGPVLAVALMGIGMIAAATAERLFVGVTLAVLTGAGLLLIARAVGGLLPFDMLWAGLAVIVASVSFAARGTLFAKSAGSRGWWIALAVIAGEAGMLFTAAASPDSIPGWLLVLLPAQWASAAISASLSGAGAGPAHWELLALAGTAAATLLVARLWPRRWPYLIMFGTWIGLSALVWHKPVIPLPMVFADVMTAPRA